MELIANNDPNLHWSKTTVALTFMQWDYKLTVNVDLVGNVSGFDLFDVAISKYADRLADDYHEDPTIFLRRPLKDVLPGEAEELLEICLTDDGDDPEEALKALCVSIQVVDRVPAKLNQSSDAV